MLLIFSDSDGSILQVYDIIEPSESLTLMTQRKKLSTLSLSFTYLQARKVMTRNTNTPTQKKKEREEASEN
jgi:hypothetical protein